MKDNELRGMVLKVMYDLRHQDHYVDVDRSLDIGVPQNVLRNIFQQLKESNLIEWRAVVSGMGLARLTSYGVDVVEGTVRPPISIVIDQSVTVSSSQNVIVGSGNVQTVSIDVEKLNLAIDHSKADFAEKAEAKSLLKKLIENKLLRAVLERWIGSKLGT